MCVGVCVSVCLAECQTIMKFQTEEAPTLRFLDNFNNIFSTNRVQVRKG